MRTLLTILIGAVLGLYLAGCSSSSGVQVCRDLRDCTEYIKDTKEGVEDIVDTIKR